MSGAYHVEIPAARRPTAGGRRFPMVGALYGANTSDGWSLPRQGKSARPGGGRALRGGALAHALIPRKEGSEL